jgi:hypothetical protein
MNGVEHDEDEQMPPPRPISVNSNRLGSDIHPYRPQEAMVATSRTGTPSNAADLPHASVSIGAIDNSLSWPWKHPDAVSHIVDNTRFVVRDINISASGVAFPLDGSFFLFP